MSELPVFENKELVVFDLDGTLVDTFEDIALAANYALKELGHHERPVDEVRSHVGHGGRMLMAALLPDADEATINRAFQGWKDYYFEHPCEMARAYDGAAALLSMLRDRDIHVAVLSNKLHDLVGTILRKTHLSRYVELTRGELPDIPRKPDPAPLRYVMEFMGVSEEQTLMVGDGVADIQVGMNTGVDTVGVSYGVTSVEDLYSLGARHVLNAPLDLLKVLPQDSSY